MFARAELYRRRGNPRDLASAATFYATVLQTDDQRPDAWRGLGLVRMRNGDVSGGKTALQRYLQLRPDASDATMIGAMIG